jgi:hypothetical protein
MADSSAIGSLKALNDKIAGTIDLKALKSVGEQLAGSKAIAAFKALNDRLGEATETRANRTEGTTALEERNDPNIEKKVAGIEDAQQVSQDETANVADKHDSDEEKPR